MRVNCRFAVESHISFKRSVAVTLSNQLHFDSSQSTGYILGDLQNLVVQIIPPSSFLLPEFGPKTQIGLAPLPDLQKLSPPKALSPIHKLNYSTFHCL